jgi:hypothetical protein
MSRVSSCIWWGRAVHQGDDGDDSDKTVEGKGRRDEQD